MGRRAPVTGGFLLATVMLCTMLGSTPAAADSRPDIGPPSAFDAPVGQRGGIMSPAVSCADSDARVRVRWSVTNLDSGDRSTYRWRVAAPGMRFPRLPVGDYRSRTVARCDGASARDVRRVSIGQKTHLSTVSRSEFRRIERGMTPRQVRRIVGNPGRDPFRYGGRRTLTYDNMAFWRWSLVSYRDGRVVAKHWDVGHD